MLLSLPAKTMLKEVKTIFVKIFPLFFYRKKIIQIGGTHPPRPTGLCNLLDYRAHRALAIYE